LDTICFWGHISLQNYGQGNIQQITQGFNRTDDDTGLTESLSASTELWSFTTFVFEISFDLFYVWPKP
jgi:hypothetical protein